jgi:hypothetical protein
MTDATQAGADAETMDPTAVTRELIDVTARLADLVERETAALKTPRTEELAALEAEKRALAHIYVRGCTALRADPARFQQVALALRDRLLEGQQRLSTAMAENEKRLKAMTRATEKVIGILAEELQKQRDCGTYTAKRRRPRNGTAAAGITLDQRF